MAESCKSVIPLFFFPHSFCTEVKYFHHATFSFPIRTVGRVFVLFCYSCFSIVQIADFASWRGRVRTGGTCRCELAFFRRFFAANIRSLLQQKHPSSAMDLFPLIFNSGSCCFF